MLCSRCSREPGSAYEALNRLPIASVTPRPPAGAGRDSVTSVTKAPFTELPPTVSRFETNRLLRPTNRPVPATGTLTTALERYDGELLNRVPVAASSTDCTT